MPKGTRAVPVPYVCADCGAQCLAEKTGVVPSRCKPCFIKDRTQKAYARLTPEKSWRYQFRDRMKKYGLDADDMEKRVAEHDGLCEICKEPGDFVDHCHATLTFRGFLCRGCNTAAGMLQDQPARARALADYLEAHIASA